MTRLDSRATQLVRDAKAAIVHADRALKQYGLKISKVDLELSLAAVMSGGGGVSFELLGVGVAMGGDHDRQNTTTLHLSLVPDPEAAELMASAPEEFVEAIVAVAAASAEAAGSPPEFDLADAAVTFQIEVTNSGEFKFLIRGSGSRASGSTMTISLVTR
jgi:hypothetical protein